MSEGLTVEQAQKELREMFPNHSNSISFHDDAVSDPSDAQYCVVTTTPMDRPLDTQQEVGATLNEAMAQVRAFKQSQAKEQP